MARKLLQTLRGRMASQSQPVTPEHAVSKLLLLLLVPVAAIGGWATITVEDLPDHLVAAQPVTLTFTVRQHGVRPLDGLKPRLQAVAGRAVVRADATPASGSGRYRATFTVPTPGAWTITIHSGFGNSQSTLEPITAIAAAAPARAAADATRGRQLFLAKGCGTCHLYRGLSDGSLGVGPELTERRFAPEYLTRFLADPMRVLGERRTSNAEMPNLHLSPAEIAALAEFLKGENVRRS